MRALLGPVLVIIVLWGVVAARHVGPKAPAPPELRRCAWRLDPAVPGGALCADGLVARALPAPGGATLLALGVAVDLNRATAAEIAAVPGIGPAGAAAIVRDRCARGRFQTIEELSRVRGFGPRRLANVRPYLRAGPQETER